MAQPVRRDAHTRFADYLLTNPSDVQACAEMQEQVQDEQHEVGGKQTRVWMWNAVEELWRR